MSFRLHRTPPVYLTLTLPRLSTQTGIPTVRPLVQLAEEVLQ
jgi:hypothetical protein